ncbi:lysophospholipid acyltransferase family protein [Lachnoanaerobaculum umeaense]|jgi:1-acylglycerol-3-phosphate O-acyltransferases|uniref:1-acyl-sn-glycerol-3-phosphate acyltransferase n=1 Tax=Lachnoanaerobaculum umeaense TaxID=617123 RepID=A0A385Q1M0_9FIRM|nr:lysophospholipid acyltransferase family protein [Lachnoanaerobaculum umeaense]AYA99477.1 1-acyl-sn-glycerol-3-phosphate acyltransferase [Lachnoanaerobaculum umeaense]PZW95815.1 1-acyl-sn-glycerol-3-phosphate acyltransferase [Lachnoanaerobaculum umeaense]
MIRFILVALCLLLYLILFIPTMFFLLIVKRFKPEMASTIAQAMVRNTFRLLLFLAGAKVEVRGQNNIPKDGGVLFVSNHRSYFDILAGYGYTYKPLGFVAKYEMIRIPLLRQWMKILNCLFLNRKDIKQGLKTILLGIEKVKSGISIWICPEGTRNLNDDVTDVKDFKEGSLKIAEKGKVPIIPVAIYGTYEIWEQHLPYMKKNKVIIEYGEPIIIDELSDADKKKLGAYTRGKIVNMLENMVKEIG